MPAPPSRCRPHSVLAVPAIRGFTRSNTVTSANRQLLDDFALARQWAINTRSVVHVIFVPPYDEVDFPEKWGKLIPDQPSWTIPDCGGSAPAAAGSTSASSRRRPARLIPAGTDRR